MKPHDVARARMRRSGLLGPLAGAPAEVVRSHLAMQAQDFGPAKWSIAQRLDRTTDEAIARVFDDGIILRTHVLRPTWHFVARDDLRWLMELTGPRVKKGLESRARQLELDARTISRALSVFERCLAGGTHLTRRRLAEELRSARVGTEGQRLPYLLMYGEVESVICSGAVIGKEQTFALFDERVPKGRPFNRDRALVELVRRYLTSHGPASLIDMSWWSGLKMADLRAGLEGLGDAATSGTIEGITLWSVDRPPPGGRRKPVVQLLQAYDELVVGYTQSRYLGDRRQKEARAAFGDRDLHNGTMMLGTRLFGRWRRTLKGSSVEVDVALYEHLRGDASPALETAVAELGRYLGREPRLSVTMLR